MSYQSGEGAIHQTIRRILKQRKWWRPLDLQTAVLQQTGKLYSDGTLTRRLREMADVYSRHRTINGKPVWDYCLVKTERKAA